jgi:polysaccharide biosynthesis/export protein
MRGKFWLFLIVTGLAASSARPCNAQEPGSRANVVTASGGPSSVGDDTRPELRHRMRYTVQRSDTINLTFPVAPEYNQTVTVQPDGYISLMGVGEVHVEGMTLDQLTNVVRDAYTNAKILHEPIVSIDVKDFQKPFFVVSGQVAKPGQYDLRYNITVSEAIAVAGGLMPTAKTQVLIFHRVSANWMKVEKFNLKDVLNGKNVQEDALLEAGDMVFVPEKLITNFRKYIPYTLGLYSALSPANF